MLRSIQSIGRRLVARKRPKNTIPLRQRRTLASHPSRNVSLPVSTDNNGDDETNSLPSKPIDFELAAKIEGEESQIATVDLRPGDRLRAESGSMLFMTEGVQSTFHTAASICLTF